MNTCQNCRYGDRATDDKGVVFYYCRLAPPKPVMSGADVVWVVPPMLARGSCGQFKLAFFRWLFRGSK